MFGNNSISTVKALENHIKTLEFAFLQVYPTIDYELKAQLEIELGNAYHCKMQLIKNNSHDNSNQNTRHTENYPSKLHQKTTAFENAGTDGPTAQNMEMPQLWEYHI